MNSNQAGAPAHRREHTRGRGLLRYAVVLLVVFLIGFVPMWWTARSRTGERDAAQAALRISAMQNAIADAAIDAGRGEYEPARQAASAFFTALGAEVGRGPESSLNEAQQAALRPVLGARDEIITLLARGDQAAVPRLVEFYVIYREQTAGSAAIAE